VIVRDIGTNSRPGQKMNFHNIGLLTLEDVIEELIQEEIEDETDDPAMRRKQLLLGLSGLLGLSWFILDVIQDETDDPVTHRKIKPDTVLITLITLMIRYVC